MEWGQFVELDNPMNHLIPKQKKYKKRIIETYTYLEKIEEEETQNNEEIQETQTNEEQLMQEIQSIFTISIPFIRKKMRIQLKNPKLFSYFSFTIISIATFIFIYKPYNSGNC